MKVVDIKQAKKNLSSLIQEAVDGHPFAIAVKGNAVVKVIAVKEPKPIKRIGFMDGMFSVPEDFDRMGAEEIREIFSDG